MVSIAGFMSSPFFLTYGATKAALKIFIESVNVELERAGSSNRLLNVSPGSIAESGFSGGATDLKLTTPLAREIIAHAEAGDDLFIPRYEEVREVLELPHRFPEPKDAIPTIINCLRPHRPQSALTRAVFFMCFPNPKVCFAVGNSNPLSTMIDQPQLDLFSPSRCTLQRELQARFNPEGSDLRRMQHRMDGRCCVIDGICRRHGLRYWLCSGTLLGAVA